MAAVANCPRCGTVLSIGTAGGLCPRCVGAFMFAGAEKTDETGQLPPPLFSFGRFELMEEIGRGAMGVVYRARQLDLDREVALKVILAGQFASDLERKRFLAEAESVARLDHPNIVPIYAVGEHDERQFYAMKLIAGERLGEGGFSAWDARKSARTVASLARAVHHAHQRGVLHRDLKPANILIDSAGEPHITDFGLARRLDADGGLTLSGSLMGTPAYMSPEQVEGKAIATTASDIYSLGAILYELLAGRPPFIGTGIPEILRQVVADEAAIEPLLSAHHRPKAEARNQKSRDLATICLKCLHKEPTRRYGSAAELAEDLEAWLSDLPISARPVHATERVWLWAKRRPAIAFLSGAVLSLLLVLAVVASVAAVRLSAMRVRENQAHQDARARLFDSLLAQARALRTTQEPGRRIKALEALRDAAKIRVTPELRDEALAQFALVDYEPSTQATPHAFWGNAPVIRPQFDCVATIEPGGSVMIREFRTGQELYRWRPAATNEQAKPLAFSPDGRWLALAVDPGKLVILDSHGWKLALVLADARFGDFSPDSSLLAALTPGKTLGIYNLANGARVAGGERGDVSQCAFHPDPLVKVLACIEGERTVVWDWSRNRITDQLAHEAAPSSVAWRGDILATGLADGSVRLWNLRSRRLETLRGQTGVADRLVFSPDGHYLISHSFDGSAVWWDVFCRVAVLRAKTMYPLQFSADGGRLALADFGDSATVKLIIPANHRSIFSPEAQQMAFSPDGRWVMTTGPDRLEVFDLLSAQRLLTEPVAELVQAAFTPEGNRLLICTRGSVTSQELRLGDFGLELAAAQIVYRPESPDLQAISVANQGRELLVAGGRDRLLVVPLGGGDTRSFPGAIIPRTPRQSADGNWLAAGTFHGRGTCVWDGTNATAPRWLHTGNATVGFNPAGTLMFSAATDRLRVFETGTWRLVHEEFSGTGTSLPNSADWSPSGNLLAFIRQRSEIVLLNTTDWSVVGRLTPPNPVSLEKVSFHPGGRMLATMNPFGCLEFWDLEGLSNELGALGIPWEVTFGTAQLKPVPAELASVRPLAEQAALPAGIRSSLRLPVRSSEAAKSQIDLSSYYNARLDEDWHGLGDPDNSWANLGVGLLRLRDLPFDVRGVVQLASRAMPPSGLGYPEAVTNIRLNQTVKRLHFLVACGYGGEGTVGETIGQFIARDRDGMTHAVPLRLGMDLADWWEAPQAESAALAARIAWRGATVSGQPIRLFLVSWENPTPEKELVSLDFASAMHGPAPFLLAITAE